jgi:mannose-6-phosphate isomerase-like protein (cupin superfamily)
VPRYSYHRVSALPATDEGLRRYVELSGPDALANVTIRHTVMQPGADLPVTVDDVGQLFITISGRGVMLLDGARIEVSAKEVVFVQPGCPCGLQTLGVSPWSYLLVQS